MVGAFLRTYGLDAESYWLDEVISLSMAQSDIGSIANPPQWEVHVLPLYYLLLHFWVGIAGTGEFGVRLLSVLFGVLCIPVTFLIGRLLFDSDEVGLMGALILTFSMFHLRYSQEARMYSLLALTSLVCMYLFLRSLKENRGLLWFGYGLSSVLLVYTHLFGWFILAVQVFLLALWRPGGEDVGDRRGGAHLWKGFLVFSFAFVAFMPWMLKLLEGMSDGVGPESLAWLPVPGPLFVIGTFFVFASGSLVAFIFLLWLGKDGLMASLGPVQRRIGDLLAFNSRSLGAYVCFFWLLAPVVGSYLLSVVVTPIFHPRYLIICSPALFLLAARGLADRRRGTRLLLVMLIIVDGASCILAHYFYHENERWGDVADYLENRVGSSEILYVSPSWFTSPVKHYYSGSVRGVDEPCKAGLELEAGDWLVLWEPSTGVGNGGGRLVEKCGFELVEKFPSKDILYTLNLMGIPLYEVVSPNIILYRAVVVE